MEAANESLRGRLIEPLPTFVPLTAYGPLNFALANHAEAEGGFSRRILAAGRNAAALDLTDARHLDFFLHGYAIGGRFIREHPGEFLDLLGRKWSIFLQALKLGWTQWNWPGGLIGVRRPVDLFAPDANTNFWLLGPWILLGLVLCLAVPGGSRRWGILVLVLTAAGFLVTGLFFGYVRHGILLLPFWYSLASVALIWVARQVHLGLRPPRNQEPTQAGRERQPRDGGARDHREREAELSRSTMRIIAGLVVALLLLEAWGATTDRNFEATGTRVEGRTHLNPDDTMYLKVLPSGESSPR